MLIEDLQEKKKNFRKWIYNFQSAVLEMTLCGGLVVTEIVPQPQKVSVLPTGISSLSSCQSVLEQNTILGTNTKI